jgi:hypothetical protein
MLTATNPLLCNMTVTLLWKYNELIVTQQELLRYYSNATTDLTCHNTFAALLSPWIRKTTLFLAKQVIWDDVS